jgi:hypothetical protein
MAAPGSAVAVGDVLAAIELARPLEGQLTRERERLAFAEQMAEGLRQAGNVQEAERQVTKVEMRSAKVTQTLRALADVAVVATAPGTVEETLAHEGDAVASQSPALRLRPTGYEVRFELSREEAAQAHRLAFCQVEVDGYLFECAHEDDPTDTARFKVGIASVPAQVVGKPARLARARFEGAWVLPASALLQGGRREGVFVVAPKARLELRSVAVAERDATQVIVLQGLDAGDLVVTEATSDLRAGDRVRVEP